MVQIAALINPDMLIEVEVEAMLSQPEPGQPMVLSAQAAARDEGAIAPQRPQRPIASNRSPADMDVGYLD